jgi:hypothetical protein
VVTVTGLVVSRYQVPRVEEAWQAHDRGRDDIDANDDDDDDNDDGAMNTPRCGVCVL